MPSRNVIKIDVEHSYYHVYARGASRQAIFLGDEDYAMFLGLLRRYLSVEPTKDPAGREYKHLRGGLELLCFCLMPNHFHLMVYQHQAGVLTQLMRGIMPTYTRYFNDKYSRSGPMFETRFKSSRISNDTYLMHISRYIHLNPREWRSWQWSSLATFQDGSGLECLQAGRILKLFSSRQSYLEFVADYEDNQRMIESIKHELAN